MLLYGAGGHSKVILDILLSLKITVEGVFDDTEITQYDAKLLGFYSSEIFPRTPLIISIGDNGARMSVSKKVKHPIGLAVHGSATVAKNVPIGEGSVLFQQALVQTSTRIGKHVILNTACRVDHDCVISDYVHVAPGAILCGNVRVAEGALIGAGSTILPGIQIGSWSIVGAGTVITENVPDGAVVVGNPGRIIKKINTKQ